MTPKQLREEIDNLFGKKATLNMLHQEIAENFYPERADFTLRRTIGNTFADNLTTSYPVLCRRDLGDQLGVMLRPTNKPWFHTTVIDDRQLDNESRRYLEWADSVQRRAMYDPITMFTKAAKQGDHDFASFGGAAISVQMNRDRSGLSYQCWHLRDMVWQENSDGQITLVGRRWKPGARELVRLFPRATLHNKIVEAAKKRPFEEVTVYHIVVDAELYDGPAKGRPRWSIYYDAQHDQVIEATPIWGRIYVIPRWQTVSGSQYPYSPATVAALPDARLLQAMTYTILEAGEKAVNPPLVATADVVRSDVALFAGGITWVDNEYDERLGAALRPIEQDLRGLPFSQDMQKDSRLLLYQAFYLNKLSLPPREGEMTAFETAKRVEEYIRGAIPLFEPMEMEYNGGLCEETREVMQRAGFFGSPDMIPRKLRGSMVQYRFESPLHDAIERQKGVKWLESKQLIADAMTLDQGALAMLDVRVALRDALQAIGTPSHCVRSEIQVEDIQRAQEAAAEARELIATLQAGSEVAGNIAGAEKAGAEAAALAPA